LVEGSQGLSSPRPTRRALRVALEALTNEPRGADRDRALAAGYCELARLELDIGDDPSAALRASSAALAALPPEAQRPAGEPRPPNSLRARALVERSAARARGHDPEGCLADVARTLVELLRLRVDAASPDLRCSLARVEAARARALLELGEPELALEACAIARDLLGPGPASEAERILPEVAAIEVRGWILFGHPEQGGNVVAAALEGDEGALPSPIRAELLVLAARVSSGPAQVSALEVAESYLSAAASRGAEFVLRWAALELARAKALAPNDPQGARLAFAAARSRLEPALETGRSDLLVPLLRIYGVEINTLPSSGPNEDEWVRLDRVLRVACRSLERGPATAAQRRAWQSLLGSLPAQTAIRTAPAPLRGTVQDLATLLGQPTPHPLVEEEHSAPVSVT
jgi:hypothetical protein